MKKQIMGALGLAGLCFASGCGSGDNGMTIREAQDFSKELEARKSEAAYQSKTPTEAYKSQEYFSSIDDRIKVIGTNGLTGWEITHIAVADFNGDNKPDIVVASRSGQVVFLENRIGTQPKVEKEE